MESSENSNSNYERASRAVSNTITNTKNKVRNMQSTLVNANSDNDYNQQFIVINVSSMRMGQAVETLNGTQASGMIYFKKMTKLDSVQTTSSIIDSLNSLIENTRFLDAAQVAKLVKLLELQCVD